MDFQSIVVKFLLGDYPAIVNIKHKFIIGFIFFEAPIIQHRDFQIKICSFTQCKIARSNQIKIKQPW